LQPPNRLRHQTVWRLTWPPDCDPDHSGTKRNYIYIKPRASDGIMDSKSNKAP